MKGERQAEHRKNLRLEGVLQELNDLLLIPEERVLENYENPRYPVILIVGCARSGSTLLLQWLASLGDFAYPTNMLSRFYAAPYIGGLVQQILTNPELGFHDELYEFHQSSEGFTSVLGKTKGVLAPHEFWYFWRRFFHFDEIQKLDEAYLATIPVNTFVAELAALESVFDKPLAMKGMIVNWNISFINQILPKVLFVHIQRSPILNAQSLLESRRNFFGSIEHWYSFKPPEYEELKNLDPYQQVAGQVFFTNQAISAQLRELDPDRCLSVEYEEFCHLPEGVHQLLLEKLENQGWKSQSEGYQGPASFRRRSKFHLTDEEIRRIAEAFARFSEEVPGSIS